MSLEITQKKEGEAVTIGLSGRLDTTTAPQFEEALNLEGVNNLTLDFTDLQYISSAGLRVLLTTRKKMNSSQGNMVVKNANDMIMDVFEATGFSDIIKIEPKDK